ncbi:hypothetical protein [Algicola sagamiensis]|uniref:hypothetical protein n=1 Tax=Algicola sagamiensis TaxID=163869 RepID=UPI000375F846|nr:hypothetical protein [Algicola sagamiensis]
MNNIVSFQNKQGYKSASSILPQHLKEHEALSRNYRHQVIQLDLSKRWALLKERDKRMLSYRAGINPDSEFLQTDFESFPDEIKLMLREAIVEILDLALVFVGLRVINNLDDFCDVWGIEK